MDLNELMKSTDVPPTKWREVKARASELNRLLQLKVPFGGTRNVEILKVPIALEMALRELDVPYERSKLIKWSTKTTAEYHRTFEKWRNVLLTDENEPRPVKYVKKPKLVKEISDLPPPPDFDSGHSTSEESSTEKVTADLKCMDFEEKANETSFPELTPSMELKLWREKKPPAEFYEWARSIPSLKHYYDNIS